MKIVGTSEASAAQLIDFASTHLGLTGLYAGLGRDKILETMRAAGFDAETIEVSEPERKPRAKAQAANDPDRMVRIHITTGEGNAGNRPVEVAVNGALMLIPRGKDVEIPYKYLHVLQNARARYPETDDNGAIVGWRDAPTYPVSVLA